MADTEAKASTTAMGDPRPIPFKCIKAYLNRNITDPPIQHSRTAEIYSKLSIDRDNSAVHCRKDATLLAQVRSGHCKHFKAYLHRIDPSISPNCPQCDHPTHDLDHWWFECPGTSALKMTLFGEVRPPLSKMTEDPEKTVLLTRQSLVRRGRTQP